MMRVAIDGRPLQHGFREHQGRGIGVYAVELVRALARRGDVALTLWRQPELDLPAAHVPDGVRVRDYPRLKLPLRDRLARRSPRWRSRRMPVTTTCFTCWRTATLRPSCRRAA